MTDGYLKSIQRGTCRPLKVAFVSPFLFRHTRGIERYTFSLANELARRDVETHLLTWTWSHSLKIDELDDRVRVWSLPTSRYFATQTIVPFYVGHLLRHRYDFVWINFAGYGEAEALTLVRRQRFGVVFHYPLAQVPHRYREFQRYGLAGRAARIVSVSRYVAAGVKEFFGRDTEVIHHGVDTERFKADTDQCQTIRNELGLGDGPLLITAAALEERKGIQWVLRALSRILERFPRAMYLVLGEGDYRATLEQLAIDLGIQSHVRFLGELQDVTPFYQGADISLILARGEASSLTSLESLACELPVIAARRPPFDELIRSDYGMLVDEEDASAVADAVERILECPALGRSMGEQGRARVREDFTWKRAGDEYLQVMESALPPRLADVVGAKSL